MAGLVLSPNVAVAPAPAPQPVPATGSGYEESDARSLRIVGVVKIVCGVLMVIFQIAALAVAEEHHLSSLHIGGTGIWCGILFIISGVLGFLSGKHKNKGLAIAYLVFAVLNTCVFTIVMIGFTGGEIGDRNWRYDCFWYSNDCRYKGPMMGLSSVLLILSVVIFISSVCGIISSSIVLHKTNACCCYSSPMMPAPAPVVVCVPNSQATGMVYQTPQNMVLANGQATTYYGQTQYVVQSGQTVPGYGNVAAGINHGLPVVQNATNPAYPPPYKFQE